LAIRKRFIEQHNGIINV